MDGLLSSGLLSVELSVEEADDEVDEELDEELSADEELVDALSETLDNEGPSSFELHPQSAAAISNAKIAFVFFIYFPPVSVYFTLYYSISKGKSQ